jgi:hypothetical protein
VQGALLPRLLARQQNTFALIVEDGDVVGRYAYVLSDCLFIAGKGDEGSDWRAACLVFEQRHLNITGQAGNAFYKETMIPSIK